MDLNQQAQEILKIAEKHGVEQNFFFITTFKRYQVLINILNDLEKSIKQDGTLVTKEYVKGRQNIYSHPAITAYNRTADSANRTASTLMKVIVSLEDKTLSAGAGSACFFVALILYRETVLIGSFPQDNSVESLMKGGDAMKKDFADYRLEELRNRVKEIEIQRFDASIRDAVMRHQLMMDDLKQKIDLKIM